MDKISGIIPASARTKVTDVSTSQPVRPGAPSFGRPEGKNSLGDRVTLSKRLEEMRQAGEMPGPEASPVYKNPTEAKKLRAIDEINQKFMNLKSIAREQDQPMSEEVLKSAGENDSLFVVEKELQPKPTLTQQAQENE